MEDAVSPLVMRLQALLAETSVVGASVAVVRKDSIGLACAGLKDAVTAQPVDCEHDDHRRSRMRTHANPSA